MIIFKNCSKRELDKNQLKSNGELRKEAREMGKGKGSEIPEMRRKKIAFVWSELMELGEW